MDFDWRLGILILNGVAMFSSVFMFTIIKFNDLRHLAKDVEALKIENKDHKKALEIKLDRIFKRLGHIDKAITKREAICDERHK